MAFGSSGQSADFIASFPDFINQWTDRTKELSPLPSIESIEARLQDARDKAFTDCHTSIYAREQSCSKIQEKALTTITSRVVELEARLEKTRTEVQDTLLNTYAPIYSRFHECQSKCQDTLASDLQSTVGANKGKPDPTSWMDNWTRTPAQPGEYPTPSPSPSPPQTAEAPGNPFYSQSSPADGGSRKTPFICCDEPRVWNEFAYTVSKEGSDIVKQELGKIPGSNLLLAALENPQVGADMLEFAHNLAGPKPPQLEPIDLLVQGEDI